MSEIKGPLGDPDYREYVRDIHASGQLLLSIVNDLLDTAKLESGRLKLDCAEFDAGECARDVVKQLRSLTDRKKLVMEIETADGFPEKVYADRRATVQILNNLIANAAKHSDDGAAIRIRWHNPEPGVNAVSVIDTGSGMGPELIEKIGDPYLQEGSYALQTGEKGAGLGLYICSKLIAAMGGRMEIESDLGQGATVTMAWPDDCNGPGCA